MNTIKRLLGAAIIAAATFASQALATEVQTTSYSAWLKTVSGAASEWDFNIPNSSYNTASGYNLNVGSFGPVNVTGPDGSGFVLNKNYYGSSNTLTLESAGDGVGTMVFHTPVSGLTAFLFGLGESGTMSPITMTLSDGETFAYHPTVGGTVFAGLSSATPITSVTLSTTSGSRIELSDYFAGVSNQNAAPVPSAPAAEVATMVMIGSGLLFFGAQRKIFSNLSRSLSRP